MMISGFFGFFAEFFELSPSRSVLNIYIFFFGFLAVFLEYKGDNFFTKYTQVLRREAHFLYDPYGRGQF